MPTIPLPLELIIVVGILFLILVGFTFYFGTYFLDMKNKNKELDVFLRARNEHKPAIGIVDLSDRIFVAVGDKDKKYDSKLSHDELGLKIDPTLASNMPKTRLEDGLPFLIYGVNLHFPLDINGGRGIVQMVNKIRKDYPRLSFIRDDIVLMELLSTSGEDLREDVNVVLNMFPQEKETGFEFEQNSKIKNFVGSVNEFLHKKTPIEDPPDFLIKEEEPDLVTPGELVGTIEDIKSKLSKWKVRSGWFSMKDAIQLLPTSVTSSDMKRVEIITKTNMMNEMAKKLEWWKEMATPFLYTVGALGTIYMLIVTLK